MEDEDDSSSSVVYVFHGNTQWCVLKKRGKLEVIIPGEPKM